jgi:hypothetical protein
MGILNKMFFLTFQVAQPKSTGGQNYPSKGLKFTRTKGPRYGGLLAKYTI